MNAKIVKVTKEYFETEDGKQHPMMFELDEVPTVEEFQEVYDEWVKVFQEKGLIANGTKTTGYKQNG
ncbi:MAG: hypothetical protein GF334_11285 [Candidatus Altiarchaeales archaeon]|nr:hypothetical protein [Candidatus Altiarchaeales archaeon]